MKIPAVSVIVRLSILAALFTFSAKLSIPAAGPATSAYAVLSDNPVPTEKLAQEVLGYPQPRTGPWVIIEKPGMDALFVGPATITIEARATDRGGKIREVRFFDDGYFIGKGKTIDGERFVLTKQDLPFGRHVLTAVAIDNKGLRANSGATHVIVNGHAHVAMESPAADSLIEPGEDVVIVARATAPSGVSKLQFYFASQFIGDGHFTAPDRYSITIPKASRARYKVEALVIDSAGMWTLSSPLRFVVSKRPTINIEEPKDGDRVAEGIDVSITALSDQVEGDTEKVDFFADDKLLGSKLANGTGRFFFTWHGASAGVHSLTAVATDELGVTGKSPPVKITVTSK